MSSDKRRDALAPPPEPTSQGDGAGAATAAVPGPVNRIVAVWQGEQRFDTGRAGAPTARLDGTNETGQSPVDALLSALATCSGVDVLEILEKRRTPAQRCEIDVSATRRATSPRRVLRFELVYRIDGPDIERHHAERAIRLAIEKYCTVAATLNPDVVIETRLTLNGEPGDRELQPIPG